MFTIKELSLVQTSYFEIIRQTEDFIEFKSKNTGHCWIIYKHSHRDNCPIWLYHKHKQKESYYHRHWQTFTVVQCVKSIKKHDEYVIAKQQGFYKECSCI